MSDRADRCLRCGKVVPWGQTVCRECNPAGLAAPSRTQYHATVFIAVLLAIAVMAAVLLIRG